MPDHAQARLALDDLIKKYDGMTPDKRLEISEAGVVRQFIDLLLRDVLGYPIENSDVYKYEETTAVGRPDVTLTLPNGEKIYVEAKRFGVIKDLATRGSRDLAGVYGPAQLALPGMANDRTPEEQQAINYAFGNGATWAILTNFERLRLFNAKRDWLVLSFETHYEYRNAFDQLWQLSYESVQQGSLSALSNQRWTVDIDRQYLSFINDAREKLALDLWRNRGRNDWIHDADGQPQLASVRHVIQRFLDRLVIVRFAEDHLVMPPGTMRDMMDIALQNIYAYTPIEFLNKIFRKFDEFHNSSLFALDRVDQALFSDHVLDRLVRKLYEVRYRSITADILGNTYEEYLGKALVLDGDVLSVSSNLETRKKQGSYYTPTPLVHYLVDTTLGRLLYATHDGTPDGERLPDETPLTLHTINGLTVLDAACGSGSFLIYAYQVLAGFYQHEIERLKREIDATIERMSKSSASAIDMKIEVGPLQALIDKAQNYPHLILERHLYGVDLDPQASELAAVNLILRALERRDKQPLPMILNQNVKTGNGLIGLMAHDERLTPHTADLARLIALRREVCEVSHLSERHDSLLADIKHLRESLYALFPYADSFSDVERVNPFHWGIEFPEVFYNADGTPKDGGGFTVIVGNPPWEVIEPDIREFYAQYDERIAGSRFNASQVERRIAELNDEDPRRKMAYDEIKREISQTAAYFNSSADYQAQTGKPSTHLLFTERVFNLLAHTGRLGYLVPSGIYTDAGSKALRELFYNNSQINYLYGIANVNGLFPSVDSRFKFTLLSVTKGRQTQRFPAMFFISHADWSKLPTRDPNKSVQLILQDQSKRFHMSTEMIRRFSPDIFSVMEFQTQRDYIIAETIYNGYPLLSETQAGEWNVKFSQEINLTSDKNLFFSTSSEDRVPLYEGKMVHHFNPYFAAPHYWVNTSEATHRVRNKTGTDFQSYRLAFRDVARSTDERTWIAAILPQNVFAGHTLIPVKITETDTPLLIHLYLLAVMNSFCVDSMVRSKVGLHVTFSIAKQIPIPRLTAADPRFAPIVARSAWLSCHDAAGALYPAFAALWDEVSPLSTQWAGVGGGVSRQQVRDELDALVAHLYGLGKDDYAHILKTFPLVFPATAAGEAKLSDALRAWERMRG